MMNMSPAFASENTADCSLGNMEHFGQCFQMGISRSKRENLSNGTVCKLGHSVKLSNFLNHPTFALRVLGVVFLSAKEKVIRIYTRWIIAFMANAKLSRRFASNEKPRQAACENHCFFDHYVPVSFEVECPYPRPAFLFLSFYEFALASLLKGFPFWIARAYQGVNAKYFVHPGSMANRAKLSTSGI